MRLSPFPITSDWVTPVGSISPAAPLMSADVAALAHSLCSIPNTKHSHRPVFPHHLWRNTNQHLSKHAPHFLPTALPYAYICAHTLVHCSFQLSWIIDNIICFQDQALPQVHCGASPKSLPWFLYAKPGNPHAQRESCCWGQLPLPALPQEQEKTTGPSPRSELLRDVFWRSAGYFLPKPSWLLGQVSWLQLTTGTAGTATCHGWLPQNIRVVILPGGSKYTRCPLRCQEACGLGKARDRDPQPPRSAICLSCHV